MRAISNLIVAVLMVGCATANTQPGNDHLGVAELHVDARPLLTVPITRVSVEFGGQTQDLVLNFNTGTFDGVLFLPAGTQSLVARAFGNDLLVGQSQPATVQVTPGVTTRVLLRILDVTGTPGALYGPILDSVSFPTTTSAGTPVTFSVSAIAPKGDPVTYAWSSDCADSAFTAPTAATTGWSKAAQGPCTITVLAMSNGFTVGQSFGIVVFPAGASIGAADVSATFIASPTMFLSLGSLGCFVQQGGNGSCAGKIASPDVSFYQASVQSWGGSTPGTLDLSDSCGGRFGTSSRDSSSVSGFWLPPVGGGLCLLTMHAVSGDGLSATLTAAGLTRPGTAPTARPPQPQVSLNGCPLSGTLPPDCGLFPAGGQNFLFGSVNWDNGHPGSVTISDDCAGAQPDPDNPGSSFQVSWQTPNTPGTLCTTTLRATNLEGVTTEVLAFYHLFGIGG